MTTPVLLPNYVSVLGVGTTTPTQALDVAGNISCSNISAANLGIRNKLINGDMRLDQRATSLAPIAIGSMTAATASNAVTVDRWTAATGIASGSLCALQVPLSNSDIAVVGAFNKAVSLSQTPVYGLISYIAFDNFSNADLITSGFSNATTILTSYNANSKCGVSCLDLTANPSGAGGQTAVAYASYTIPSTLAPSLVAPLTVSMWFNPTSIPSANAATIACLTGTGGTAATFAGLQINLGPSQIYTSCWFGGTNAPITASYTFAASMWYHYCLTIPPAGGVMTLYINGIALATSSTISANNLTTSANTALANLLFGALIGPTNAFKGYVDEFRIYNRVLSVSEVTALATNVGIPTVPTSFTPPIDHVSLLSFDSTATDSVGMLGTPLILGTNTASLTYNTTLQQTGTACLDLTANPSSGGTAATYLSYSSSRSTSSSFTISFWLYPTGPSGSGYQLVNFVNGSPTSAYGLEITLATAQITLTYSGVGGGLVTLPLVNYNAWNHIVCNISTTPYCYINGTFTGSGTFGAYTFTNMTVGGGHQSTGSFKGYIDDFRVYNRTLVPAEAALMYSKLSAPSLPASSTISALMSFNNTLADSQALFTNPIGSMATYNTTNVPSGSTASLDLTANPIGGSAVTYATYTPPASMSLPMSMAAWVYISQTGTAQMIWNYGNATTIGTYMYLTATNIAAQWVVGSTTTSVTATFATAGILAGKWIHLCTTLSYSGYQKLYVNGLLVAMGTTIGPATGTLTTTSGAATAFRIGANCTTSPNEAFRGLVDDFRVYNIEMTPTQIIALAGIQPLSSQLTFDNTTSDALGNLSPPTVTGGTLYCPGKVSAAGLDLTTNPSSGGNAIVALQYPIATVTPNANTFSMWINPSAPSANTYFIPLSTGTAGAVISFEFVLTYVNSTTYGLMAQIFQTNSTWSWSPTNTTASQPQITAGVWTHIAAVANGATLTLYVNGVSYPPVAYSSPSSATYLAIGSRVGNQTLGFKGYVDDVRLYNVALASSQVAGIYIASQPLNYSMLQQTLDVATMSDVAWGTSNAQPVTVSAWVKNNTPTSQSVSFALNNAMSLMTWLPFDKNATDVMNGVIGPVITGGLSLSTSTYKVGASSLNVTLNTVGSMASTGVSYTLAAAPPVSSTYSSWFNISLLGASCIWSMGSGFNSYATTGYSVQLMFSGTYLYADVYAGTGAGSSTNYGTGAITNVNLLANTWYHAAVVVTSPGYVCLYLNGLLVAQGSSIPSSATTIMTNAGAAVTNLRIGAQVSGLNAFQGYIDDFRIYTVPLSSAQVAQLYSNNAATTTLSQYLLPRSYVYATPAIATNTWSKISWTIPGDTTGTWSQNATTSSAVLSLCMSSGSAWSTSNAQSWNSIPAYTAGTQLIGSSNVALGLGNSMYLTGVQLERGAMATLYDFRPYSIERQLSCTQTAADGVTYNVGFGTSAPQGPLHVATTGNSTSLVVLSSGNVGVGTSNPAYTLDVNGNINASGSITTNGLNVSSLSFGTLSTTTMNTSNLNNTGKVTIGSNVSTGSLTQSLLVNGNILCYGNRGNVLALPYDSGCIISFGHTGVIGADGQVYTAGYVEYGVAGYGNDYSTPAAYPRRAALPSGETVKMLAMGSSFSFALTNSNRIYSWGRGDQHGILGLGNGNNYYWPQLMSTVSDPIIVIHTSPSIIVNNNEVYQHVGYLTSTGRLFLWGYNPEGELGVGNWNNSYNSPQEVANPSGWGWGGFQLASLSTFAWSSTSTGSYLWATGYNPYGHLGNGDTTNRNTFTRCMTNAGSQVSDVKKIRTGCHHVADNKHFTVVLTNSGQLWTCGYNGYGQIGDGTQTSRYYFYPVISNVVDFDVCRGDAAMAVMAVTTNGNIYAWGYNGHRCFGSTAFTDGGIYTTPQLIGNSASTGSSATIVRVFGMKTWGISGFILVDSVGKCFATGYTYLGCMGVGTVNDQTGTWRPVLVNEPIVDIRCYTYHYSGVDGNRVGFMFLGQSGRVYGSGIQEWGWFGQGNTNQFDTPQPAYPWI